MQKQSDTHLKRCGAGRSFFGIPSSNYGGYRGNAGCTYKITPGIAADETLLYGVEVKFYSNRVIVNKDFETSICGLRAIGDGAGVTRGLQQASANGISVARSILRKIEV